MATEIIPDDQFVPDAPEFTSAPIEQPMVVNPAPNQTADFIPDNQFISDEDKYGTPVEQGKAAFEAAGRGLIGSAPMTWLGIATGSKPEAIRGREEANPVTAGVAEASTFIGGALLGTGEAALLSKASSIIPAAKSGGRLAQAGVGASKAAFEGILYQSDKELAKSFTEDPAQTVDSMIANVGMTSVLSGMFGGAVGAAFSKAAAPKSPGTFVSELDVPAIEAGDLAANIKASDTIKPGLKEKVLDAISFGKEKKSAAAVRAAAKELDDAPIVSGALLESPLVQTQLDALSHSRYTVAGNRVGGKFDEAYNHASGVLDTAINAGPTASKAELGNALKEGLTNKIRNEYKPIQAVYDELSATHSIIPIEEGVAGTLTKELSAIPEFRVSPSSPQGQLVRQVLKDIDNVNTLNDLKILKDGLSLPATASSQERRMVGILRDKLGEIEESAVEGFAKAFPRGDEAGVYVKSLLDAKREITPVYKKFIGKVSELSEQLGKGKVHGTEDALRFMNERLTPEQVASRVFAKNDSEFLNFFSKNFPEEFQVVRNYQRAEMIEKVSKSDAGFKPKDFFKNFNALEPEVQAKLYTPGEIKKINAAETYIREAFPKDYQPSHTAHVMAMRSAYESPKGFAIANVRDYAIEKAIQAVAGSVEGKQAVELAQATIKGENLANRAIKSVFNIAKDMPNVIPMATSRAKLDRLVTQASQDPSRLVAMNDNNNSIPEYSGPLAASASRVVNYLSQLKPNTSPANTFDGKRVPSAMEKSAYDRALDIAEQPLVVLAGLKDGRITPTDVQAVRSMYPNLYNKLVTKITGEIVNQTDKGNIIPYKTRIGLAIFLGQPMDSTMTPAGVLNAQPVPKEAPQEQGAPQGGTAKGYQSKALNKSSNQYQTPDQARQQRSQRR